MNADLIIARLSRPRGNKGELSAVPWSDNKDRFAGLKRVFLNGQQYIVETIWWHGDHLVFKFSGIDSISQAEKLAGLDVCLPVEERVSLAEGEYFQSDLIGCEVVERATGKPVGVVVGWQECGGPPLLEVQGEKGEEILIPFARSICLAIDVAAKQIQTDLPEGLRDLNQS